MKSIIIIEYSINLILLLVFHMHMFQLNSYFPKKHIHWMKNNIKKMMMQVGFILVSLMLLYVNHTISMITVIILLALSIIYNMPKQKAKVPFQLTNRVKRMFLTEGILIGMVIWLGGIDTYLYIKLGILNIFSSILCMIANAINMPIEYFGQQRYIKQAKKILNEMPDLLVIGVTGSYGKTSVKNFLYKILSTKYEVLKTPKNFNTTMGVVKTIREKLKPTHQIFICEMGATKPGDIKEICDIVKPKMGIITSIGPQHLESFKTMENIIKTKFELADSVKENHGVMFLNGNDTNIANIIKENLDMKVISYGVENKEFSYNAYDLKSSSKGLTFKIQDGNKEEIELKTKLIGKHNVMNITAAIAIGNYLGIPIKNMKASIREIQSVEHRLQLIPHGNLTIIDDSYNANPVSSKLALDTLAEFEGIKIIVTPGLIELGEKERKYNFEFGQYITEVCDYIFLVGEDHSKEVLEGIHSRKFNKRKIFVVHTPEEAVKKANRYAVKNKVTVLLENDLPDNYNV